MKSEFDCFLPPKVRVLLPIYKEDVYNILDSEFPYLDLTESKKRAFLIAVAERIGGDGKIKKGLKSIVKKLVKKYLNFCKQTLLNNSDPDQTVFLRNIYKRVEAEENRSESLNRSLDEELEFGEYETPQNSENYLRLEEIFGKSIEKLPDYLRTISHKKLEMIVWAHKKCKGDFEKAEKTLDALGIEAGCFLITRTWKEIGLPFNDGKQEFEDDEESGVTEKNGLKVNRFLPVRKYIDNKRGVSSAEHDYICVLTERYLGYPDHVDLILNGVREKFGFVRSEDTVKRHLRKAGKIKFLSQEKKAIDFEKRPPMTKSEGEFIFNRFAEGWKIKDIAAVLDRSSPSINSKLYEKHESLKVRTINAEEAGYALSLFYNSGDLLKIASELSRDYDVVFNFLRKCFSGKRGLGEELKEIRGGLEKKGKRRFYINDKRRMKSYIKDGLSIGDISFATGCDLELLNDIARTPMVVKRIYCRKNSFP